MLSLLFLTITAIAQNADIDILKNINSHGSSFKNGYAKFSSNITTPVAIAVPAGIAIAGFITKDEKLKRDALFMAGSYIVNVAVTQSIKHIIKRPRPFEKYNFIIQRTSADKGVSFPSGHTSAAFATATSVVLHYCKWYFAVPAYVFAGSVAWARMYQGVHYPSDVLVGAIVGSSSAWLGYKLQNKWLKKKQMPSPNPKF